jgi:putative AdoMet-dependent methyltransferase
MTIPPFPFHSSDFDVWAETYDTSVASVQFPFLGYRDLLAIIFDMAHPRKGCSVLDLGTGTGNLAQLFAQGGCDLWCTDFSIPMIEKAHLKIPDAHFFHHDLRSEFPAELDRVFDYIVSAYVFHHFDLDVKIRILGDLLPHLSYDGKIFIGDIAFPDADTMKEVRTAIGPQWEEEFYWLVDESLSALREIGIQAKYLQVSSYAGVFVFPGKKSNNKE